MADIENKKDFLERRRDRKGREGKGREGKGREEIKAAGPISFSEICVDHWIVRG